MNRKSFERLLLSALKDLPVKFRHHMENVQVIVEDTPSPEVVRQREVKSGSLLLGLYQGVPKTKRGFFYSNVLPDKITLFQKNIEKICTGGKDIKTALKDVLIHEIGHHYGLGEEDMK